MTTSNTSGKPDTVLGAAVAPQGIAIAALTLVCERSASRCLRKKLRDASKFAKLRSLIPKRAASVPADIAVLAIFRR